MEYVVGCLKCDHEQVCEDCTLFKCEVCGECEVSIKGRACDCGSGELRSEQCDGRNIFLYYYCSKCESGKRSKYRPEIFEYYNENDVCEQIEDDY